MLMTCRCSKNAVCAEHLGLLSRPAYVTLDFDKHTVTYEPCLETGDAHVDQVRLLLRQQWLAALAAHEGHMYRPLESYE